MPAISTYAIAAPAAGDYLLGHDSSNNTKRFLRASVAPPKGYIYGLTLSNNGTDATNDIDIAAGEASATQDNPYLMVLAATLTKRLDAAWAVGSGNGGLDTGAIADTTYHVWLIQRSDTGVVDALFSTSASAPTMPANYDRKRRIGSIMRVAGAIRLFWQTGDKFIYRTQVTDRNSTAALAFGLLTISVPLGIMVEPSHSWAAVQATAGTPFMYLADARDSGNTMGLYLWATAAANEQSDGTLPGGLFTNTSAQIRAAVTLGGGTLTTNTFYTNGYTDRRGQDGGL